ncbi:hypothetical protein CR513_46148, partial [Mucuna pruriens]
MKAFSFSLDGVAKDLVYLQPVMFTTWGEMKCMFLENGHPEIDLRNMSTFGETLHEYWERFNKLCAIFLHHQINEQLLL